MANASVIPNGVFPPKPSATGNPLSLASRAEINATAQSAADRQLTAAALDALVPIPYGRVRLGAKLCNALVYANEWVFWIVWGMGPLDAFESITANDAALPTGSTVTHYLGTAAGAVDATLVAAFGTIAGLPVYAEALPGIAYSVVRIPVGLVDSPPQFNAIVRGRKVYDPRDGGQSPTNPATWLWSRNPALILADFLTSATFGEGKSVDWSSVVTVANKADVVVGVAPNTEVRRLCDIVIDKESTTDKWAATLRTAAACWIVPQGDTVKLIADDLSTPSISYDHASGNVLAVTNDRLRDARNLPTVVEITYTNTSATPWRKSTVAMPWITRYSQARREAIERINKLWLRALSLSLDVMDEGLRHEPGDTISLTFPEAGYSSLPLRITKIEPTADGWRLQCEKEDSGAYSTVVETGPTIGNTPLPSPTNPPTVAGLTGAEELFRDNIGTLRSRIRATWTAATYPFLVGYRVEVFDGTTLVDSTTVSAATYASPSMQENRTYAVNVYALSPIAQSATPATFPVPIAGTQAKPTDVPFFNGYEVAGEVRLNWISALDLDLAAHEIRYSTTAGSWESSILVDRVAVPAQTYTTRSIPVGIWRFWIKGLDSTRTPTYPNGQQSVTAKSVDIEVDGDPDTFVANLYTFTTPTLTNMVATVTGGVTSWVTDSGATFNSLFPSALNTYTNPLQTYAAGAGSTMVSESFDFGQSYSGFFVVSPIWTDLSGTASLYLELSADNTNWTQYPGANANANARFGRFRLTTTGSVRVSSLGSIRLDVVSVGESQIVTTSASGWLTVNLARRYTQLKTIQLTSKGIGGVANPVYSNVVISNDLRFCAVGFVDDGFVDQAFDPVNSIDVKAYDSLNALIAVETQVKVEGI